MKKLLLFLSLIPVTLFSQNLTVNGDIIRTDPTYVGAGLTIHSTQNQNLTFTSTGTTGLGDFFVVGPGNAMNVGSFSFNSLVRGAIFSSSTSGVNALATWHGLNRFNIYDGRSMFGQNVVDDGFSLVYVHGGFKADSIRLNGDPGATGDVLTKQANGTYRPQTPSGGGTQPPSGTYVPTVSSLVNISTGNGANSTWVLNNKVLTLYVTCGIQPTAINTLTSFKVTLPAGYTIWTGATYKGTADYSMNSGASGFVAGVADATGPSDATHVKVTFIPTAAAGTSGDATFTISFLIP